MWLLLYLLILEYLLLLLFAQLQMLRSLIVLLDEKLLRASLT